MIKLALNTRKYNNYAFFCPVSRLHLTVSNPVGSVNEVTPAILKALKSKTLLDVDGVVNIEAGSASKKAAKPQEQPKAKEVAKAPVPTPAPEQKPETPVVQEEVPATEEEKPAEEPKRKGKKAEK